MPPRPRHGIVAVLAWAVASPLAVGAEPADGSQTVPHASASTVSEVLPQGVVVDRIDWAGSPQSAKVVIVENDFGDIRARGSEGDEAVSVHAVVQRLDSVGEKLTLGIERVGDALRIRVEYPLLAAPDPELRARRPRLDRADLAVLVPDDVRLEVATRQGLAEVKEFGGDIEVRTGSGDARVVGKRSVRVRTVSGAILAYLRKPGWSGPIGFESDSGAIDLTLPAGSSASVHAETTGKLELGYPVVSQSKGGSQHAELTLGAGGSPVIVSSRSGAVRVVPESR